MELYKKKIIAYKKELSLKINLSPEEHGKKHNYQKVDEKLFWQKERQGGQSSS